MNCPYGYPLNFSFIDMIFSFVNNNGNIHSDSYCLNGQIFWEVHESLLLNRHQKEVFAKIVLELFLKHMLLKDNFRFPNRGSYKKTCLAPTRRHCLRTY